jgi:type IV pilus assembly protein PilY1
MVPFPNSNAPLNQVRASNEALQQVLLGTRPYGATPIDAMMDDARSYFWTDAAGPSTDPFVTAGCRDQYIILLTDGAPNMDMRTACQASGGTCPYDRAKQIAFNLADGNSGAKPKVKTFVIGFALSSDSGPPSFPTPYTTCRGWYDGVTGNGANPTDFLAACTAANPPVGSAASACCNMNEVSINGSGTPAYFAENQAQLAEAMASILGTITKGQTTRTIPSYSGVSGTTSEAATFLASFNPSPTKPWSGNVTRERLFCDTVAGSPTRGQRIAPTPPVNPAQGDSFETNLIAQNSAGKRRMFVVNPAEIGSTGKVDGAITLRSFDPAVPTDGFNAENVSTKIGLASVSDAFTTFYDARVFETTNTSCRRSRDAANNLIPALNALDCAKVSFGFALSALTGLSLGSPFYDFSKYRCPGGICSPLGAIFHSNPVYVGRPSSPLRDESYQDFARMYGSTTSGGIRRPNVLYAASIDGILHAFQADSTLAPAGSHTELWSFIPPAVLPRLKSNLPRANQLLLDGQITARDVVFDRSASQVSAAALTGANSGAAWHTVLIGSYGQGGRGFYALDVTNPGPGTWDLVNGTPGDVWKDTSTTGSRTDSAQANRVPGPQFLWQLTDIPEDTAGSGPTGPSAGTDNGGRNRFTMFGNRGATPTITTLFFDPAGGTAPREIAVALLPGGLETQGIPLSPAKCDRYLNGSPAYTAPTGMVGDRSDSAFARRTKVRRWQAACADPVPGRSLTIVRLDTGEIVRVFSRRVDVPRGLVNAGRWTDAPFDSPMTGTPMVFPTGIGSIGQKAFVGDADGTIWRIDLSGRKPDLWEASLFLDTQAPGGAAAEDKGEPIEVNPTVSIDEQGRVVLSVSTGEQDQIVKNVGQVNYVYSVTEVFGTSGAQAKVNWYKQFMDGARVTGPMTVFDSAHFFATYEPPPAAGSNACTPWNAFVRQWEFIRPKDTLDLSKGGLPRTLPARSPVNPADDLPNGLYSMGNDLVPGVSIRNLAACSSVELDQYASNPSSPVTEPGGYELIMPQSKSNGSSTAPGSQVTKVKLPPVRRATRVDSWVHIVD